MNVIRVIVKSEPRERVASYTTWLGHFNASWSRHFNSVPTMEALYAVVTDNFDGYPSHVMRATLDIIQAVRSDVLKATLSAGNYLIPVRVAGILVGTIKFEQITIEELSNDELIPGFTLMNEISIGERV